MGKRKAEIKHIRYENVILSKGGSTNISSAIHVDKNLKHSSILKWKGVEDAMIKKELIRWRLGRIAFHQNCECCNRELSRKHALICSGGEFYLENEFEEVEIPSSNTILDAILNYYSINGKDEIWKKLYNVIQNIKRVCLVQNVDMIN